MRRIEADDDPYLFRARVSGSHAFFSNCFARLRRLRAALGFGGDPELESEADPDLAVVPIGRRDLSRDKSRGLSGDSRTGEVGDFNAPPRIAAK